MKTIYQCRVDGISDIDSNFVCRSQQVFSSKAEAEKHLPIFIERCKEKRSVVNLHTLRKACIVTLQLVETGETIPTSEQEQT